MTSQARQAQVSSVEPADDRRPPADGGTRHEGGGALQRFVSSALAGILTVVFAWQIVLGSEEADGESRDDADNATKTTPTRRVAGVSLRVRCAVSTPIDQPGVGGSDPVTHGNAAGRRVSPPLASQLGAAGRLTLPGNWNPSSARAPAGHSLSDMPSRNCGVEEGDDVCGVHVGLPSVELYDTSSKWNRRFPPVARHSGGSTVSLVATPNDVEMSGADRREREVPSFRRRPLTRSTSSGSDDEPASPCSCSGDEINFFHAFMTQDKTGSEDDDDDDDRKFVRPDDDEGTDDLPEVTSSTWISLFRTFFMGGAGQQQQRPAAVHPTTDPISRRLQDRRDIHDLLDRTLSTISEEGGDEVARKISELDDDIDDEEALAWQHEPEDETNSSSDFEDDDDDFYSDSNTYQFADDTIR